MGAGRGGGGGGGQEGAQGVPRNGSICTLTMQTTGGLFVTFNMEGEMFLELLFKHYYFLVSHVIVSYYKGI